MARMQSGVNGKADVVGASEAQWGSELVSTFGVGTSGIVPLTMRFFVGGRVNVKTEWWYRINDRRRTGRRYIPRLPTRPRSIELYLSLNLSKNRSKSTPTERWIIARKRAHSVLKPT